MYLNQFHRHKSVIRKKENIWSQNWILFVKHLGYGIEYIHFGAYIWDSVIFDVQNINIKNI